MAGSPCLLVGASNPAGEPGGQKERDWNEEGETAVSQEVEEDLQAEEQIRKLRAGANGHEY